MAVSENELISFRGFPRGADNVAREEALPEGALRAAINVDLDKAGKPRRRAGYTKRIVGALTHSLWSPASAAYALGVIDGALTRIERVGGNFITTMVRTVDRFAPMSYCEVNGEVYYANGVECGKLDGEWGVEDPAGQPSLSAYASGGMDAGLYQVAVTYLAASGEESGATLASVIEVAAGGGIRLENMPQPTSAAVSAVRVYVSPPNGEVLYHQRDIPVGMSAYILGRTVPGKLLETQFSRRVLPGHIVRHHNGRLYIALGDTLYYTEALRFGLFRQHTQYFRFPARITMVEPVEDGIYVGAGERTYFLAGKDAVGMQQRVVVPHGAIEGTGLQVSGEVFVSKEFRYTGSVALWWATNGVLMRGLPSGEVHPLTGKNLAVPTHTVGALLYREVEGAKQIVSLLRDPGVSNNLGARDSAVAEIIRNGVVVN